MSSLITSRFALKHITTGARATSSGFSSPRHRSSTMHDNDPDTLDIEKRRNLSNQQHRTSTPHENAPGWNEHLASASEASVKADRSTASAATMQEKTVEYVRARYAPDDRMSPTTAHYSRDEVSGPLGTAPGQEDAPEIHTQTVVKKVREETTKVLNDEPTSKGT